MTRGPQRRPFPLEYVLVAVLIAVVVLAAVRLLDTDQHQRGTIDTAPAAEPR